MDSPAPFDVAAREHEGAGLAFVGNARLCGQREPLQAAPFDKEFKGDGEAEHEVLSILRLVF